MCSRSRSVACRHLENVDCQERLKSLKYAKNALSLVFSAQRTLRFWLSHESLTGPHTFSALGVWLSSVCLSPAQIWTRWIPFPGGTVGEGQDREVSLVIENATTVPLHHRLTLQYLLTHLAKVTQAQASNGLDAQTLGQIFGPLLIWSSTSAHWSGKSALWLYQISEICTVLQKVPSSCRTPLDEEFAEIVVEKLLTERTTQQDVTPPGIDCYTTEHEELLRAALNWFVFLISSSSKASQVKSDPVSHDWHRQPAEWCRVVLGRNLQVLLLRIPHPPPSISYLKMIIMSNILTVFAERKWTKSCETLQMAPSWSEMPPVNWRASTPSPSGKSFT